jgi:hypothetical protein
MIYRFKIIVFLGIAFGGSLFAMQPGDDVNLKLTNEFPGEIRVQVQTPGKTGYFKILQYKSVNLGALSDVQSIIVSTEKSRIEIMGTAKGGLLNCWNSKAKGESTMEVVISNWSSFYPSDLTWSCGAASGEASATSQLVLQNKSNETIQLMLQNPTKPTQKPDAIIINAHNGISFNIPAWAISRLRAPLLSWNNKSVLRQAQEWLKGKDKDSLADKNVILEFSQSNGKRTLTTRIEGLSKSSTEQF